MKHFENVKKWPVLPDPAGFTERKKILAFVSNDVFQEAIHCFYMDNGGIVATNGAVLAKIPCSTG